MALLISNATCTITRKVGGTQGTTTLLRNVACNVQRDKDGTYMPLPGAGTGVDQAELKPVYRIYTGGADENGVVYNSQAGDKVAVTGQRSPSNITGTYLVVMEAPASEGLGLDYNELVTVKAS